MESQPNTSSLVTRVVIVLGIVSLLGMIGYGVLLYHIKSKPVYWSKEFFCFRSGPHCLVFIEPKLAIFIGDGGEGEIFDRIDGLTSGGGIEAYDGSSKYGFGYRKGSGSTQLGSVGYTHERQRGSTILRFVGGKCVMTISEHATKLTLADGRKFVLDGQMPLWLRCKSDGTIDKLDELPEGFVEFFKSPNPDSMMHTSVTSYPKAFQK